ncbi:MAG: class II fructose-bisphosphate aldolase [Candidatus Paceibacterota bacterium]|jgi:fructose-bisphosphate aldolase class II|nr:class II fructose-bisphosphate aldolase [Candidatus Paceibacterota bacterium]
MEFPRYFKKAQKERWAIGQFNVSDMNALKGVVAAAVKLKSPIIIGTSEGESGFLGLKEAANLVDFYRRKTGLPILLNLDHGRSLEYIKRAINEGYSAVHFDGSKLPLNENIKIAGKVKDYARKRGVLVEGEMDAVSGSSSLLKKAPEAKSVKMTDPLEAKRFVSLSGVDSLAVSIGTFHGQVRGFQPKIDLERLKDINNQLKNTFLVMHGGSGVSEKDIRSAISLGIVKINVNTELRVAYSQALKKGLSGGETTPYKYLPEAVEAVQKVVEKKIKLFGSSNKI